MSASVESMDLTNDPRYVKLRKFNIAMGTLHLVQFFLMMFLITGNTFDVYGTFLRTDTSVDPPAISRDVDNVVFSLPLGLMVALFLLASAIAHFSVASPWGYPWYVRNLAKGINYARWYEYGISSSIMIVVIAMLCGIFELSSLILIFALNAVMNMMGLMMEVHNQITPKTDWTAFIIGCFAGIVPWIVIGIYFFAAILTSTGTIPAFVYAIFIILAIFFNVFALNMVAQYRKKGRWADYLFGERVYIILSLTAKTALAWLVFGGTNWPT
jgi:hypothetical protein